MPSLQNRDKIPDNFESNSTMGGKAMAAKYEIKKAQDGQFFFNLKATNGQVILSSEMYKAKGGAQNGIHSVQKNSTSDNQYERKTSKNHKNYFVLKAKNSKIIGQSQMYSSASSMEKGIESVKKNGSGAMIEDLALSTK